MPICDPYYSQNTSGTPAPTSAKCAGCMLHTPSSPPTTTPPTPTPARKPPTTPPPNLVDIQYRHTPLDSIPESQLALSSGGAPRTPPLGGGLDPTVERVIAEDLDLADDIPAIWTPESGGERHAESPLDADAGVVLWGLDYGGEAVEDTHHHHHRRRPSQSPSPPSPLAQQLLVMQNHFGRGVSRFCIPPSSSSASQHAGFAGVRRSSLDQEFLFPHEIECEAEARRQKGIARPAGVVRRGEAGGLVRGGGEVRGGYGGEYGW
ncbi:hypothetical protein LTR08_002686 [Meristemomyces frigidus]|nr:hypothetical protein LTR08_002686 [Meristemomyces frigidus]